MYPTVKFATGQYLDYNLPLRELIDAKFCMVALSDARICALSQDQVKISWNLCTVPLDSCTVVTSQILAQCHLIEGGIQEINQNFEKS